VQRVADIGPSTARRWTGCGWRLAGALICGCSGAPFITLEPADGAPASAPTPSPDVLLTPGDGGLTPIDASQAEGGGAGEGSACGPLRGGDTREVCFVTPSFTMGSDLPNLGSSFADHTPSHPVTLQSFALDAYEVSMSRYGLCVQAGGCTPTGIGAACIASSVVAAAAGDTPVLCVTWGQANAFCEWDGDRRLPTEAEWEFAARGIAQRTYPWGGTFSCALAVVGGYPGGPCSSNTLPGPVTGNSAGASPEQVYNLAGNVAEWTADWVGSYLVTPQTDPTGPASGTTKVVRGGAFSSQLAAAIGYARMPIDPTVGGAWGFRCARDAM
jgi:formylglycine-generating enzyme required for sulfatase activity